MDILVVVQNIGVAPVHRVVVSPGMLCQCWVGTVTWLVHTSVFMESLVKAPACLSHIGSRATCTRYLVHDTVCLTLGDAVPLVSLVFPYPWPPLTSWRTYCFRKWRGMSFVAKALSSTSSITRLAIVFDTSALWLYRSSMHDIMCFARTHSSAWTTCCAVLSLSFIALDHCCIYTPMYRCSRTSRSTPLPQLLVTLHGFLEVHVLNL